MNYLKVNDMTTEYRICSRCIMDLSDPDIQFNAEDQCNHCIQATRMLDYFGNLRNDKPNALDELVLKIQKAESPDGFHAIVGVSGGLDSSYLLHLLSQYELKILPVHVDAGWNSIESVKNINSMVSKLNLDLETIVINWEEMRNLQIAYLRSGVINQDVPQDHAFFGSLFRLAKKMGISYVISGSNYATESILPKSWGQNAMDGKQIESINRMFGSMRLRDYPLTMLHNLYSKTYVTKKYNVVAPLNLIEYTSIRAKDTLVKEFEWVNYGGKHKESRFTDYFQEVYLPKRFSIIKKRAHLSSLIVNNELKRDDALRILNAEQLSEQQIDNHEKYIASKLGIAKNELQNFSSMPYVSHKKYANQEYLTSLVSNLASIRTQVRNVSSKLLIAR